MAVGALLVAAVSRILTPAEVGVTVLGLTLVMLLEMVRDVPSTWLIQREEMTRAVARTAFTVMFAISCVIAAALWFLAPAIATYEGDAGLIPFFRVIAVALLLGPFERPLLALLRRDMAFEKVAVISVAGVMVNAVAMIVLALAGFSYMAFAWAMVAAGIVVVVMANLLCPRRGMLGIDLSHWRGALRFGAASSLWGLIWRFAETLPSLSFGVLGALSQVGLYGRVQAMIEMPGRLLFSAIMPVALPAFSSMKRSGQNLNKPILGALELITAVHWPTYLVLACLAHPATMLLLGPQWVAIVPALQVMAVAKLLTPIDIMVYPLLMAQGAVRLLVLSALIPLPGYLLLVPFAVQHGLMAVSLAFLLLLPFGSIVGLLCLRRVVTISLGDLLIALRRSAVVALAAVAGPLVMVVLVHGGSFDLPWDTTVAALMLALLGWIAALAATGHPLFAEVRRGMCLVLRLGRLGWQ
jgi:O-antigen/teichoic acid export membrane protein